MTIREIKREGKSRLSTNHLQAVLALLVPMLIIFAVYGIIFGLIFGLNAFGLIPVLVLFMFLVTPVVMVGIARFYYRMTSQSNVSWDIVLTAFQPAEYPRNLGRMIQMQIMVQLWMLLLFVPGIIKFFSYAMTPFILADESDNRNLSPITKSRFMMAGRKGKLFVLVLSFFGWFLLGALTAGILTIVYVGPYFYQTLAVFYEKEAKPNGKEKLSQFTTS